MTPCLDRPSKAADRKRVLIVCTHLRPGRVKARSRQMMQPLTGLHIAALIDKERHSVTLHHEDWHGPYRTQGDHFCVDIVFLTGLQPDFDRMRQLAYHFRRRGTVVVAGGSICSLFPEFASHFFDVVCAGGVDAVRAVMADWERGSLKPIYRSPSTDISSYDVPYELFSLAGIEPSVHLVEGSRGCSFRCSFCVVPAEGAYHSPHTLDHVRRAIASAFRWASPLSLRRWHPAILFYDNNFSDDRRHLEAMCTLLKTMPRLRGWGALVTQNVLQDHALVEKLAEARCRMLFIGLESLDPAFLRRHNKTQNLSRAGNVLDDIAYAERLGICINYGYLFDPRHTTIAAFRAELAGILKRPGFPLPAYLSLVTPLVGTADFWRSEREGELAPGLRLRDLEGETIAYSTVKDPLASLSRFVRDLVIAPQTVLPRGALLRSTLLRILQAGRFSPFHWYVLWRSNHHILAWSRAYRTSRRSFTAGEDCLDPQYHEMPDDLTPHERRLFFDPIEVVDKDGRLASWLEPYRPSAGVKPAKRAIGRPSGATERKVSHDL